MMNTNSNDNLDERKLWAIEKRLLEMETDNIVKKESNPAMIDKIYKMIVMEVDKR